MAHGNIWAFLVLGEGTSLQSRIHGRCLNKSLMVFQNGKFLIIILALFYSNLLDAYCGCPTTWGLSWYWRIVKCLLCYVLLRRLTNLHHLYSMNIVLGQFPYFMVIAIGTCRIFLARMWWFLAFAWVLGNWKTTI